MAYELKQELKISQKLLLTPQMQLAIRLLQLSRQELVETIREELEENPVLDERIEGEGEAPLPKEDEKNEIDWQSYIEDYDNSYKRGLDFGSKEEDDFPERAQPLETTLDEHLKEQLKLLGLSAEDTEVGEFIIGNIDGDGYLRVIDTEGMPKGMPELNYNDSCDAAIAEIATLLGVEQSRVARVLEIIQDFDPIGVGARSIVECLLIQARSLPLRDSLLETIIEDHLDTIAAKNFRGVADKLGVDVERVLSASASISELLNPVPGSGFGAGTDRVIIPDAYVSKVDEEYVVHSNDDGMPRLRISAYYRKMLSSDASVTRTEKSYVQERLRSASWLINSVNQRQRTIKKVVESIVRFQREFLDKGLSHLKPLVLRDVAEDIEMHESTVSRVTTNKYVHTPRGTFELKYFFTSGMSKSDGGDTTPEYIKEKIKGLLANEKETAPLSDQQIAGELRMLGMIVARRTVAKYREELGYMPSSKRKVRI
jgi:RNA polymerase sigma-54 factor